MKKRGILIGIALIAIIGIGVFSQTDLFLSEEQKAEKEKQSQITKLKDTKFAKLPIISMDELEKKINNGEDVIAYFGWIHECGDARMFQLNSFDKYLDDERITSKLYVIDLDAEALDALVNHDLRKPIAKRFQIDTWLKDPSLSPMELKSPQLVYYQNKKIVDLVSWTPLSADATYSIAPELTDKFFANIK